MYRTNISKDLISQRLQTFTDNGFVFRQHKLSKRFIDWLFRHYYTEEYNIEWYTSQIDISYVGFENLLSTEQGWKELQSMITEYAPERIYHNNWIDVYGDGIWNWSQDRVDRYAKYGMKLAVKSIKKKDRIYFAENKNKIIVYIYMRDIRGYDGIWFMEKRKKTKSVGVCKSEEDEWV